MPRHPRGRSRRRPVKPYYGACLAHGTAVLLDEIGQCHVCNDERTARLSDDFDRIMMQGRYGPNGR
jgi:hypothetical protein